MLSTNSSGPDKLSQFKWVLSRPVAGPKLNVLRRAGRKTKKAREAIWGGTAELTKFLFNCIDYFSILYGSQCFV